MARGRKLVPVGLMVEGMAQREMARQRSYSRAEYYEPEIEDPYKHNCPGCICDCPGEQCVAHPRHLYWEMEEQKRAEEKRIAIRDAEIRRMELEAYWKSPEYKADLAKREADTAAENARVAAIAAARRAAIDKIVAQVRDAIARFIAMW